MGYKFVLEDIHNNQRKLIETGLIRPNSLIGTYENMILERLVPEIEDYLHVSLGYDFTFEVYYSLDMREYILEFVDKTEENKVNDFVCCNDRLPLIFMTIND